MATLNLGRIKPVFRDAYAGGTAYVVDDIVTFGDETFICILASTGNATSNATYWKKLAAKGTDGTDVGTTITTQGDILYRDGSGLARLGFGTSGHVLTTKGTGANPTWEAAVGGKIGQVLCATKTDTQSFTSASWTDITDLTIAITPSATSSKIWWSYNFWGNSGNDYGNSKIVYGTNADLTTQAIGDAAGSRRRGTGQFGYDNGSDRTRNQTGQGLDAPNTTSATTYKLQYWQPSGTYYINRSITDSDNNTNPRGLGSLTVMEVLA